MTTLKELAAQYPGRKDDYPSIAEWLNAPQTIDNPRAGETDTTTETTIEPITLKEVMALVPPTEAAKIYDMGTFVADLKVAIDAGDKDYMAYMLSVAAAAGSIGAETIAALFALLAQTDEERTTTTTTTTTQPATISAPSLASAAGLGTITSTMVQEALNA
jgi:hypothetical protein